jgi:hypothetical protein
MSKGYVLPITVIVGVIIMSSLGLWYQQAVVQSFLAERLIEQRGYTIECQSLIPILIERLDQLGEDELNQEKANFMVVEEDGRTRWRIDRSKHVMNKIRFTFWPGDTSSESLNFTVLYPKK